MIQKVILVRHGQSTYNLENKFTGWKDVPLTDKGINEAKECSYLLKNYKFDICYTSTLKRAQNTLSLILKGLNQNPEIIINQDLNERDYGDLIGKNKLETAKKYGDKQVEIWRRSYDTPPPGGESLEMTCNRVIPYFKNTILNNISSNNYKNTLIAAHGNSIRAIVMDVFKYDSKQILKTEIGWCEPWILSFENNIFIDVEILSRDGDVSKSNLPYSPKFTDEDEK